MDKQKIAKEIAEEANQCCNRSDSYEEDIRDAVLASLDLLVPEGYVVVPVEATDEMLEALYGPYLSEPCHTGRTQAYKAMLKATQGGSDG